MLIQQPRPCAVRRQPQAHKALDSDGAAKPWVKDYIEPIIGVYSGKTKGVLTYREGKITRLLEWLDQEGEDLEVEMTLAGLCSRNANKPDKR